MEEDDGAGRTLLQLIYSSLPQKASTTEKLKFVGAVINFQATLFQKILYRGYVSVEECEEVRIPQFFFFLDETAYICQLLHVLDHISLAAAPILETVAPQFPWWGSTKESPVMEIAACTQLMYSYLPEHGLKRYEVR